MGRLFCLVLLVSLAQVLCVYVALGIVVDKTVHLSEINGFHDEIAFKRLFSQIQVLQPESLKVEDVEPAWGTFTDKLGQVMSISVSYRMTLPCLGNQIGVSLHYKGEGVNTGFYGQGY